MVIVDIGNVGDTVRNRVAGQPVGFDFAPQNVAYSFRAVGVAAGADQRVEFLGQRTVEGNSKSFHKASLTGLMGKK